MNKVIPSLSIALAAIPVGLGVVIPAAFAQTTDSSARVFVNHRPVDFQGQPPVEQDGHLLVPLRGVLEKMGAYVDYDNASQTVTAQRGSTRITLPIGSQQATVNGRSISLDTPAQVISGSTMVPLRFVAESLGADVNYDVSSNSVAINDNGDLSTAGSSELPDRPNRDAWRWRHRHDNDQVPISGRFQGEFSESSRRDNNVFTLKMSDGRRIDVTRNIPIYYDNQRISLDDLRSGDKLTITVDPRTHLGTRIIIERD
jgi:hypothetical protein